MGAGLTRILILGGGFGGVYTALALEKRLIREIPRSATARTRSRVNVLVMERDAFQTLFAHLPHCGASSSS
jgi:NADH dehydrogenase FAD-containing subunit